MSELKKLIKDRGIHRTKCTKLVDNINERKNDLSKAELEAKIEGINAHFNKLENFDQQILTIEIDSKGEEEYINLEMECETYYDKLRTCKAELKNLSQNSYSINGNSRGRIGLPQLQLPQFFADESKDVFTCRAFFDNFEKLLSTYKLNDVEQYSLLEQQCNGRAKYMITSIGSSDRSYKTAKALLIKAFSEEMPQKFKLIEKLTKLNFGSSNNDPYMYFADYRKILESIKEVKLDLDTMLLHFIWKGIPNELQDILINILNKTCPNLHELNDNFIDAGNRYLNQNVHANYNKKFNTLESFNTTNLATALNATGRKEGGFVRQEKKSEGSIRKCILCMKDNPKGLVDHTIVRCQVYDTPMKKIESCKFHKLCLKCLGSDHFASKCNFECKGSCYKCGNKHLAFLCNFQHKSPHQNTSRNQAGRGNSLAETINSTAIVSNIAQIELKLNCLDVTDSILPVMTTYTTWQSSNIELNTVLDCGSQHSFILNDVAEQLDLKIINSNIPILIKGFNGNCSITTNSVELPVVINNMEYTIPCICIPEISINFKTPNLDKLIKRFNEEGIPLANKNFIRSQTEEVNNVEFLLGSRNWSAVLKLKSGSIGKDPTISGFYETCDGYIIIGSIKDWLYNFEEFKSNHISSKNYVKRPKIPGIAVAEKKEDKIFQAEVNIVEIEAEKSNKIVQEIENQIIKEDIIDIATYSDLDYKYSLLVELGSEKPNSEEIEESEREVTDFIIQNSSQKENGQHIVAIPWLSRFKSLLGKNENLAFQVLKSIKKKYQCQPKLLTQIDEVFSKQKELNFAEIVDDFEGFKQKFPCYSFVSHFPLIKEHRLTTKIRIIYMANLAQKNMEGSHGLSLNNCVHPGFCKNSKIAIAFTLMRFDKILLAYDISKAYHRMAISEENSAKFLFYWFKNVSKGDFTPIIMKFNRVIFGLACAPYMLACILYKFLIHTNENDTVQKNLKKLIFQGSYVDNISLGCENRAQLEVAHDQSIKIFNENGFPLQQFVTNDIKYQKHLDSLHEETTGDEVKLLGMSWDRMNDTFSAPKTEMDANADTKRKILKSINSCYDLNNANLPVLNRAKLFLRNLQMNTNLGWDNYIGNEREMEWQNIVKQYNAYKPIKLQRFVGKMDSEYELCLLSDASKDFLGMVAYLRDIKTTHISFLCSHNKILNSAMRARTMPVLELAAIEFAVTKGLELFEDLTTLIVPIKIIDIRLYTDSTIALSWINNAELLKDKPQNRSIFLNNRIESVVNKCKAKHPIKFNHIGTHENTADYATRLTSPKILTKSKFWIGPEILKEECRTWEMVLVPNPAANNNPNIPKFVASKVEIEPRVNMGLHNIIDMEKYKSFNFAIKVLQKIKIFIRKLKQKLNIGNNSTNFVTFKTCKNDLIRMEQNLQFPELREYFENLPTTRNKIPPLIHQLNIILDHKDNLIKVKSKMGKLLSNKHYSTPILLNKGSMLTSALILDIHINFNHAGTYYVLNQLKANYFIIKAFSTVKKTVKECYHCRRFNARPIKVNTNDYKPWMLQPRQQLFNSCFIDYFWSHDVWYGEAKMKAHCVLFKCIWSKAVNIEVVLAADTKNFLMALQNHIYEYGLPSEIRTDSGSNFTGAFPWIKETIDTVEVQEYLSKHGITHVVLEQYPKGSLNRGIGGIIESAVGLLRKFIQGAIRNNVLDFNRFLNVVKQCVCYANKRPISEKSPLRNQNPDEEFFIITPEIIKYGYETCLLEIEENEGRNFDDSNDINEEIDKIIAIKNNIKENYYSEFLYALIDQSTKYKNKYLPINHQTINIGDVVLIKDAHVKAAMYPLGVIQEVVQNSLGETTQVTIRKGNKSVIKRDISSVILLVKGKINTIPMEQNNRNNENLTINNNSQINLNNSAERPKRLAAVKCQTNRRELLEEGAL